MQCSRAVAIGSGHSLTSFWTHVVVGSIGRTRVVYFYVFVDFHLMRVRGVPAASFMYIKRPAVAVK